MKPLMRSTLLWIWISLACACSTSRTPLTPTHAPTMADIYQTTQPSPLPELATIRARTDESLAIREGRTLQAHTMPTTFATVPNPLITVYVYPHLATAEQVPIPGYHTQFPLYQTTPFAWPRDTLPALGGG